MAYSNPIEDLTLDLAMVEVEIAEAKRLFPNDPMFLGGDFNCKLANFNSIPNEISIPGDLFACERESHDREVNYRGQLLLEFLDSNGLLILNGRSPSDSPAHFTRVGQRGCSVIDLVCCSFEDMGIVTDFAVLDTPTTSDHLPTKLSFRIDVTQPPDYLVLGSTCRQLRWTTRYEGIFSELMRFNPDVAKISVDVNEMNETLITAIYNSVASIDSKKSPPKNMINSNRWFDTECLIKKRELKNSLKQYKKS